VEAGIYVIDQWRQIGITVNHRQLELAGWTAAFGNGDFEVLMDSFTDISANPTTGLLKYASADRAPENRTFSIDRKLDELYDQQARELDPAKRRRIVRELEAYALEKAYAVPLLHWTRIVVHNSRLRGWTMSPLHMIYQDLGDVWLAPKN
jgi:peptide/nickel transport system substrate-binding protein